MNYYVDIINSAVATAFAAAMTSAAEVMTSEAAAKTFSVRLAHAYRQLKR